MATDNIGIGDGTDITTTVIKGTVSVGVDDAGYDVTFYGNFAGTGNRMFWDASRSALRAGSSTDGSWDDANIAAYSFGAG